MEGVPYKMKFPIKCLKPIFQCDANSCVGTLPIRTCWDLTIRNLRDPQTQILKFASPNAKPQCESVEYRLRWVPNAKFLRWACRFHVVCVNLICVG